MSAKVTPVPNTHVPERLVEEYEQMLVEAQHGVRKMLSQGSSH